MNCIFLIFKYQHKSNSIFVLTFSTRSEVTIKSVNWNFTQAFENLVFSTINFFIWVLRSFQSKMAPMDLSWSAWSVCVCVCFDTVLKCLEYAIDQIMMFDIEKNLNNFMDVFWLRGDTYSMQYGLPNNVWIYLGAGFCDIL